MAVSGSDKVFLAAGQIDLAQDGHDYSVRREENDPEEGERSMNWREHPWAGVFAATLCPFQEDESLDEAGLCGYIKEVAEVPGICGVVCNGHTGEIMSLRPEERSRVTAVVAGAVRSAGRPVKVVSGVSAEGSLEAIDRAREAREAGADGILLMPPHHWLRFGRTSRTAVGFFEDTAEAGVPIIVHQYPAWTKASYTLAEMLEIVRIPQVVCIKMGTRDMARWRFDYEKLKSAAPEVPILTCHDEYLLASLLEGADGALVGFAGFAPELIVRIVHAALDGNLEAARAARSECDSLAHIIYGFGEPSCDAHQRMKAARWLMGKFPSPTVRRPLRPLEPREIERIARLLRAAGYPVARDWKGAQPPVPQ
ncbi:MAG: dihydrodipicolinate synthase family protein [Acidobacteria bacterium]|nr:dihydrodipicolinate synthase family protein [Acidobacteriota bacterium]